MWALCDLAMSVLVVHTSTFETSPFSEIRISAMFFKRHEDPMFVNVKVYLPEKFQIKVSSEISFLNLINYCIYHYTITF